MEQEQKQKDIEKDDTAAEGGGVSDESMEAIGVGVNAIQKGEGGEDRSTEDHEKQAPTSGVGAIQDNSLIREDVAHIEDEDTDK